MDKSTFKDNISRGESWLRGFFILVFSLFWGIAEIVMAVTVLFQFIFTLITGRQNENAMLLGRGLSRYVYQVALYITYNSDDKPFPFQPWPSERTEHQDQDEEQGHAV